jgi:hypothetical protein
MNYYFIRFSDDKDTDSTEEEEEEREWQDGI